MVHFQFQIVSLNNNFLAKTPVPTNSRAIVGWMASTNCSTWSSAIFAHVYKLFTRQAGSTLLPRVDHDTTALWFDRYLGNTYVSTNISPRWQRVLRTFLCTLQNWLFHLSGLLQVFGTYLAAIIAGAADISPHQPFTVLPFTVLWHGVAQLRCAALPNRVGRSRAPVAT